MENKELNTELIRLEQKPIITHVLVEYGAKVRARIKELNIDKLVATEDTIKSLKSLRAELRKEFAAFEEQRKAVKNAMLLPYVEFEPEYKLQITDEYTTSDSVLGTKINSFEMIVKTKVKNNLIAYFSEICEMEGIDWLTFDRLNIEVNLSTTEKKYKEGIFTTISGIVNDLDLIKTDEYADEILVEYKKTLKASLAIKNIRERKQAEKIEAERRLLERTRKRTSQLNSICLVYHDLTHTYNWINDASVMIEQSAIETMTDNDWTKTFAGIEDKILTAQKAAVSTPAPLQAPKVEAPISAPFQTPKAEATQQPEEAEPVKKFTAKFQVTDTFERLTALKAYLQDNNYSYQNL